MSGPNDHNQHHHGRLLPRHRKVAILSIQLYRKLLVAYPQEFRQEYAEEMARYFGELCDDSLRRGGFLALMVTWLRTLFELVPSARAQRKQHLPDEQRDPSHAVWAGLLGWPGCGQLYNDQPIKALAHALGGIALLTGGLAWSALAGLPWYIWLGAMVLLGIYSALDAWLTARRINAALDAGSQ